MEITTGGDDAAAVGDGGEVATRGATSIGELVVENRDLYEQALDTVEKARAALKKLE